MLEETNLCGPSPVFCSSPAEPCSSLAGNQSARRSMFSASPALLEDLQSFVVDALDQWKIADLLQLGGVLEPCQ